MCIRDSGNDHQSSGQNIVVLRQIDGTESIDQADKQCSRQAAIHIAQTADDKDGHNEMCIRDSDYVDYHFDDTGYKTFTTMSMFGLTDGSWVEAENAFVREPQDSIAQRNADYFVREEDVHNPDKQS